MKTKLLLLLLLFTSTAFATPTTPTSDFIDNNDGTVTHKTTGLMWMRCAMGQTWTGSTCTGTYQEYTYDQAMSLTSRFARFSDWRLPNIAELQTIVERENRSPAINTTVFLPPPNSTFWSSSPYVGNTDYAWHVSFYVGWVSRNFNRSYHLPVRLVRASQSLIIGLVDLASTITASTNSVKLKQNITYTATMTNNGSAAATSATLIFFFPPRKTTYVTVPSGCVSNGKSYRCSVPCLAAGTSLTKAITVNYDQLGALNVVGLAITDSKDSDESNNKTQVMTTITP